MSVRSSLAAWFYPPEVLLSEQFNFGHREVLVASNDLSTDTLFLGSLQHGWYSPSDLRQPRILRNRKLAEYPAFVWSKRQQSHLVKIGFKHVIVVGSPWSHLLKACQIPFGKCDSPLDFSLSNERIGRSLLYFPMHSIPGGTTQHSGNFKVLQEMAMAESITVCLFWLDFVDPEVRAYYKQFGFKIVCAGYRGSSGFETPWTPVGGRVMYLPNILELISAHDVIATEETSTAFWYSVSLGKEILVFEKDSKYLWWGDGKPNTITISNEKFLNLSGVEKIDFPLNRVMQPAESLLLAARGELGFDFTENIEYLNDERFSSRSKILGSDLSTPIKNYINGKLKQKCVDTKANDEP
jgi:hypothetical protein